MEHQQSRSESRSYLEYQEIAQPKIIEQIEQKYRPAINSLKEYGFDDLHVLREETASLGLIAFFPLLFPRLLSGKEVVRLSKRLSFITYYPVLTVAKHGTFAQLSASTGAKFYTAFTDGSWFVSTTHSSSLQEVFLREVLGDNIQHFNYASSLSVEEAWQFHKKKVEVLGKEVNREVRPEGHLLRSYWVELADQFYKGCGGLLLFLVSFLLLIAGSIAIVKIWPSMPNWIRISLTIFVYLFPFIAIGWLRKQLNYMKIL